MSHKHHHHDRKKPRMRRKRKNRRRYRSDRRHGRDAPRRIGAGQGPALRSQAELDNYPETGVAGVGRSAALMPTWDPPRIFCRCSTTSAGRPSPRKNRPTWGACWRASKWSAGSWRAFLECHQCKKIEALTRPRSEFAPRHFANALGRISAEHGRSGRSRRLPMHDRVVRPSQVIVSHRPPKSAKIPHPRPLSQRERGVKKRNKRVQSCPPTIICARLAITNSSCTNRSRPSRRKVPPVRQEENSAG